jgi:hypothetical protein
MLNLLARCLPSVQLFWVLLVATPGILALSSGASFAQTPGSDTAKPSDGPEVNLVKPDGPGAILLSLAGGKQLLGEANTAVSAQNYTVAVQKLQQAREVFNQLSNYYQDLTSSFSGLDNRVSNSHRTKALESAQLRDQVTYQLALVHRTQNKPELAIPLLVQIIRSQQPTRDLGQKAYQQLYELGLVDSPFPAAGSAPAPSGDEKPEKKKNRSSEEGKPDTIQSRQLEE